MTSRRPAALLPLACAAAFILATRPVHTDDPVSSSVRFTGEIVRIFQRKCQPCHASDGLAMPLSNYRDVRAWGRSIREEIVEQRMPPWSAARGYGRFRNDLALSARETITVLSWIDGGMPRGEDKELPLPAHSTEVAAADVRLPLPPQRVPALQEDVIRRVNVDAGAIDPARTIARIVLAPGSPRVLRGALIYDGNGAKRRWIGAWLPWQRDTAPPPGHGFRIGRGDSLSVELHYRGDDREVVDTSNLEIYYATKTARPVDEVVLDAGRPAPLPRSTTVWAIVPSPEATATSLHIMARRPDGSSEVLLWIPRVQHDWPQTFVLDAPLQLPAGTTVSLVTDPASSAARARLAVLQ